MGYQLKRLKLCCGCVEDDIAPFIAVVVTPKGHTVLPVPPSTRTCGGVTVHALHWPALCPLHTGALPVTPTGLPVSGNNDPFPGIPPPLTARSAGSCSSRIAFGLIGFVNGAVGAVMPRANPSCSHSLVTGTHTPELFRYSTRNQPSIRFQVAVRPEFA